MPGEHYYTDIDYIKVYKIKPTIIGPSAVCYGRNFTFHAFQYYGYVTSDNYTWDIIGGYLIRKYGIHDEFADVLITDQSNFSITAIAHEPSWNSPTDIPWLVPEERISSTTKTYLFASLPSPPLIINIERWGNSCSYRAYVRKAKDADEYSWKVDNSAWENGINSGSLYNEVNYCDIRDLLPNRTYVIKVKAINCAGDSPVKTQTINTPNPPEDCTWRLSGDTLDSNMTQELIIKDIDINPTVYPIPTENQFVLKFDHKDYYSVLHIYDICGKLVFAQNILPSSECEIRFGESLKPGIYFVNLNYTDKTYTAKILKCE